MAIKYWGMTKKEWKAHVGEIESNLKMRIGMESSLNQVMPTVLQNYNLPVPQNIEDVCAKVAEMDAEDLAHLSQYVTTLTTYSTDIHNLYETELRPELEEFQKTLAEKLQALEPLPEEGDNVEEMEPGMITAFYQGLAEYIVEGAEKLMEAAGVEASEILGQQVRQYAAQLNMNLANAGGIENYIIMMEVQQYENQLFTNWMEANPESSVVTMEAQLESQSELTYNTLEKYFPPLGMGMDMETIMQMLAEAQEEGCGGCGSDCGECGPERPEPSEGDDNIKSS